MNKKPILLILSICSLTGLLFAKPAKAIKADALQADTLQAEVFKAEASVTFNDEKASITTNKVDSANLVQGCKSAYLMESKTGECVYALNETARMPIASVCKVMTLLLSFEALEEGKLKLEQSITVSQNAASMGGSQVFLKAGNAYALNELLKSIVVCSANDSCVAVSEAVAGSEEQFVVKMNKRAAELGCENTLFANCTGLPKPNQYSCAKDVATMFQALIAKPAYFEYSRVWLEDFVHPDNRTTQMTNTNKLLKRYPACDGGKTGFTNEAGFCLTATANKNDLRLISVVLGGETSDKRFLSTTNLLEYGFASYRNKIVLDQSIALNDPFVVKGGKQKTVAVRPERNACVFSRADLSPNVTFEVTDYEVKAPVKKGDVVGKISIFKDGVFYDEVNAVADADVAKATYLNSIAKTAEQWSL